MNPIQQLTLLGQSLWYDNIQRSLLESGELAAMIARGEIRGVTSNPSIFHNAIVNTHDYYRALIPMALAGWDAEMIFWQLALEDIQRTCDLFYPLYEESKGGDGYVSLEVHPALANDQQGTLVQAKDLWGKVDRPNLMIKIPATKACLPAIRSAIADGINVNVTLIFSIERYREVMEAYLSGLEAWFSSHQHEKDNRGRIPASVASFFISRMDSKVDALLPKDSPLLGKAAIANAKLAYDAFCETFSGPRWENLDRQGAQVQRPLWASTSTKNPTYPDTLYVDHLIGRDTVNTVPPQTLHAFLDHGKPAITITDALDGARSAFSALETLGVSIAKVTLELEEEGVRAFARAFSSMIDAIETRRLSAVEALGDLSPRVTQRIQSFEKDALPARLWDKDPSLWATDLREQDEIRKRLGWLDLPVSAYSHVETIRTVVEEIHQSGIRKFLLLGMGGSSLAPEVLSLVFRGQDPGRSDRSLVDFVILDSTDPTQILGAAEEFPPTESLYIVSSKSGGTAEVNAMLDYFWHRTNGDGSRFVAITDPGTSLDELARNRNFRAVLHADPTVGGRFSVFTDFGLFPMALMGMDLSKVLESAAGMMNECRASLPAARNPGLVLGAVLGESALIGRDKLIIIADPQVAPFGSWLEQLIAESSGKKGKGIIVVDREPAADPPTFGDDRLFIYLKVHGDHDALIKKIKQAGHPVLEFLIPDTEALVAEFYRWEIATVAACHILGVNAFDQPDVQDNKNRTRDKISAYQRTLVLEEMQPLHQDDGVKAYSNQELVVTDLSSILASFLNLAKDGDYIAINAYLPRNPEMNAALTDLRSIILATTRCATTLGFGPRFLHSTGQLHKGGPNSGLFLQITADPIEDVPIPGQKRSNGKEMTFGVLERAQSLGDYEALAARGRRILRLHLSSPEYLWRIIDAVSGTFG